MPYSSTALQVTPIVQNTDMNVDATIVFLTNTMHFQPEASYQWVHQHTGLHCKISCLNSGYLPRQGEIKLHIRSWTKIRYWCHGYLYVSYIVTWFHDECAVDGLWETMANHLMLSGKCLALVPTYLLEGVPFWSCSVTWPAGLPQPVVRPMLGPAQPRAPCSSQKLCLCPSPPCPSCQSPASDCGCGPCHTWMQGHAVGSHNWITVEMDAGPNL